jgi:hypothetical protein
MICWIYHKSKIWFKYKEQNKKWYQQIKLNSKEKIMKIIDEKSSSNYVFAMRSFSKILTQ